MVDHVVAVESDNSGQLHMKAIRPNDGMPDMQTFELELVKTRRRGDSWIEAASLVWAARLVEAQNE